MIENELGRAFPNERVGAPFRVAATIAQFLIERITRNVDPLQPPIAKASDWFRLATEFEVTAN